MQEVKVLSQVAVIRLRGEVVGGEGIRLCAWTQAITLTKDESGRFDCITWVKT